MVSAHTSQEPGQRNLDNGAAITLGARVMFSEAGQVSAIRFWVPQTNTGTYTVAFYQTETDDDPGGTGTGTLLASATVASGDVTADGWAQISITPQDVETNVIYTCAVHSSSGRYVRTAEAFLLNTAITNEQVTLIGDGSDPIGLGTMRNGVFTEGAALAYPATGFQAADYFVDVVWSLAGPDVIDGAGTSAATSSDTAAGIVIVHAAGTSAATSTDAGAGIVIVFGAGASASSSGSTAAAVVTVLAAMVSAATSTGVLVVSQGVRGQPIVSVSRGGPIVSVSVAVPIVTTTRR